MSIVAIGPVANLPSWDWVGIDTINELSKYYQVEVFNSFHCLPGASVIVVVKKMPPTNFMQQACDNHKNVIFMPIDYFAGEEQIQSCASILGQCKLVISHADSLIPHFRKYAPTYPIEHTSKYALLNTVSYKPEGFILWVGGYQFTPYILRWLRDHPLGNKIVFCTDYKNERAIAKAEEIATYFKVSFNALQQFEMHEWSESTQAQLMSDAKAAIDIKGNDFSQRHKPPTKGQQFVASGIPFAVNKGNNCYDYFQSRGFDVCTPEELHRWLSEAYAQQTREFGRKLRLRIHAQAVGIQMKKYIDAVMPKDSKSCTTIGLSIHHN